MHQANEELGLEVERLRSQLYKLQTSTVERENSQFCLEQDHNTHQAVAEQKDKEAEQLGTALQEKEEEVQPERTMLGDAMSQLAVKDKTLARHRLNQSGSARCSRRCRPNLPRPSRRPGRLSGSLLPSRRKAMR